MKALIIYHTNTGHTRQAAQDVAEGLKGEGLDVSIQAANDAAGWDVADQSVIIVGSPCHAGSVSIRAGVSGPVLSLLKKLEPNTLTDKIAGAFSVNCAYGGQKTVDAIEKHLQAAGARILQQGVVIRAGVPFSLFRGPMASEKTREQLREFGYILACAAKGDDRTAQ
ncbi:MAG: flavodoxin domain-containing protein [Phycisphaerae bacterium]|nr:flavodoxin domain-containing protein [Phycisphaerae bacterium]